MLTFTPAEGLEDSPGVAVTLSGRILNNNSDTRLIFIIRNIPGNVTFNIGRKSTSGQFNQTSRYGTVDSMPLVERAAQDRISRLSKLAIHHCLPSAACMTDVWKVRKAGVAPNMTLRFTVCKQVSMQMRELPWL